MPEPEPGRERDLSHAFVQLADTLVSGYDVSDLAHSLVQHCVQLLGVDATGIMLMDEHGSLQVLAASSEGPRLLELLQVQAEQGPCLDCLRSRQPVVAPDLVDAGQRWPRFVPAAREEGYGAVHAVPLRLREQAVGALNLFTTRPGKLAEGDVVMAQALADVATIGILSERAITHSESVVEQLQGALNSRVVIEQAKGMIAEAGDLDMDEAFSRLRRFARSAQSQMGDIARDLIAGRLDSASVIAGPR